MKWVVKDRDEYHLWPQDQLQQTVGPINPNLENFPIEAT